MRYECTEPMPAKIYATSGAELWIARSRGGAKGDVTLSRERELTKAPAYHTTIASP
jgi:hypothetical protein